MEKIDKLGQVLPFADLIYIKSIIQVIDDDDQDFEVEIGWENQFGERSFVTKLSTIVSSQENGLMALIDKGYLVPFNFMNDIRKYLVQSAIEARDRGMVQKYHRTLGFLKKQDQPWIICLAMVLWMTLSLTTISHTIVLNVETLMIMFNLLKSRYYHIR